MNVKKNQEKRSDFSGGLWNATHVYFIVLTLKSCRTN